MPERTFSSGVEQNLIGSQEGDSASGGGPPTAAELRTSKNTGVLGPVKGKGAASEKKTP